MKTIGIAGDRQEGWITARLAPPVFDYARAWVIFNEASKEAVDFYMQTIWKDVQAS